MWEVIACSCILPHLPPDREDRSERQLGSDPRIWGFDKPLRSPGRREAKRSIYCPCYYQQFHHTICISSR